MEIIKMVEAIKDKLSESEVFEDKGEICTVLVGYEADVVIRSSWEVVDKKRSHIKSTSIVLSIKVNGIDIFPLFRETIKDTKHEDLYQKLVDEVYSNIHATLESYVLEF